MVKNNNYTNINVRFLRELNNISQAKMSKDLDIDQSTLAKWENGTRQITLEWALKLSNYFNVDIGTFISEDLKHRLNKPLPNFEFDFKRILKEKGLMDDNGNIDKEKIDKLFKIADMMKEMNEKR